MTKKIEVSKSDVEKIKRLFEIDLFSDRKISTLLGYSRDVIRRIIIENNFKQFKIAKPIDETEVIRVYNEGNNMRVTAKKLKLSRNQVKKVLEKNNILLLRGSRKRVSISKEELNYLYNVKGLTQPEIARHLGCAVSALTKIFRKYNIIKKKRVKVNIDTGKLKELYNSGKYSLSELAKIFNCSSSTISQKLDEGGIRKKATYLPISTDELILKCSEGLSVKELASYFNKSIRSIDRYLRELGLSPIKDVLYNINPQELYDLAVTQKRTLKEVASIYNVSESTLNLKLKELKINILEERSKEITKEVVENLYFNDGLTQAQIAEHFGCGRSLIAKKFKEWGIKKDFQIDKINKGKVKEMFLSGMPPVIISQKLDVPINILKHYLYRSGLTVSRSPEAAHQARTRAYEISLGHSRSKAEQELELLYPTPHTNVSSVIGLELDLWYPEKNLAIEYNGDYWHSTKHPRNATLHLKKLAMCETKHIGIINIFERDWTSTKGKVKIKTHLDRIFYPEKFKQPEGVIKPVCEYLKMPFERMYNFEKSYNSQHSIGLYKNKELIQCVSYNIENGKCIITRYTTKNDYLEDYSRLLNFIKEKENLPIVIRYDKRYYNSSFMNKELFEPYREIEPELWCVLKKVSYKKSETPKEILDNPNHNEVYDCGYSEWILN